MCSKFRRSKIGNIYGTKIFQITVSTPPVGQLHHLHVIIGYSEKSLVIISSIMAAIFERLMLPVVQYSLYANCLTYLTALVSLVACMGKPFTSESLKIFFSRVLLCLNTV